MAHIDSVEFPDVHLRMDGRGVGVGPDGGGVVNCQGVVGPWEQFRIVDQGDGLVAIASLQFFSVFLRMDGRGLNQFNVDGGGVVNCQGGVGPWERFRLEQQNDGTIAIASVQFQGVFLRMDGRGVGVGPDGGGVVNCQFGVGPWEKFRLVD
jgi:phospholipase C